MFEKYYATLENTENYSQADLDWYNAYLENELAGQELDPDRDYRELDEQVKNISDKYLTDEVETWPF